MPRFSSSLAAYAENFKVRYLSFLFFSSSPISSPSGFPVDSTSKTCPQLDHFSLLLLPLWSEPPLSTKLWQLLLGPFALTPFHTEAEPMWLIRLFPNYHFLSAIKLCIHHSCSLPCELLLCLTRVAQVYIPVPLTNLGEWLSLANEIGKKDDASVLSQGFKRHPMFSLYPLALCHLLRESRMRRHMRQTWF